MLNQQQQQDLAKTACLIRGHIIEMTNKAKSGHPGGSLSMTDIITVLYFHWMKLDPQNPDWPERDYFVLSKGHAAPALYSAMAERGFFPLDYLQTLRQLGSALQGHPDKRSLPGIEMSTGSLGQGLSVITGMALGLKLDKKANRIYGVLGDGELQEGQVWEAAMAASHYKLNSIIVFVDKNGLQIDGSTKEVMDVGAVKEKFKAFGWNVIEIDGHDLNSIVQALEIAVKQKTKPTVIIADTVKGKGISFMENQLCFHGAACTDEQLKTAKCELDEKLGVLTCQI